jgi:enoyl-CoA hydratase/carnithine racemase
MTEFAHLHVDVTDHVATLRLDRPESLNALNRVLTGELITALRDLDADEDVRALARRLAEGPGVALRLTKRLLADAGELDHSSAVDREFTAQALCFASEDATEGAMAFLEKRPPRFRSR